MSCCDVNECAYYYKTYNNNQINCVKMFREDIESEKLIAFLFENEQNINYLN